MAKKSSLQREVDDFRAFCKGATDEQLRNIINKEAIARRIMFMQAAQQELSSRDGGNG